MSTNPMFDRLSPEMTVKGVPVYARINAVWHGTEEHYVVDRVAYSIGDRPEVEERATIGTIDHDGGAWTARHGHRTMTTDHLAIALDWMGAAAATVIANRILSGEIRALTEEQYRIYGAALDLLAALDDDVPASTVDHVVDDARRAARALTRHAYRVQTTDAPSEVPA